CGPEAAERPARTTFPDARPQPRVVGESRPAGLGGAASFRLQPRAVPVLPGRGTSASPARELRSGEWLLVRAARERSTLPPGGPEEDRRQSGRLSHLGVLLLLRRRVAALDLGHGAGHRDAGICAREPAPRRPGPARDRAARAGRVRGVDSARRARAPGLAR